MKLKNVFILFFWLFEEMMYIMRQVCTEKCGKWQQTEGVCLVDTCGQVSATLQPTAVFQEVLCSQWREQWLRLGVYITVTITTGVSHF